MADIDIFNGDADGICALTQLRNADPRQSTLITGVKRDIALVAKAEVAEGDRITALDISFDKNRDGVVKALEAGAEVLYVDHHFAGEVPESDRLTTIIDTSRQARKPSRSPSGFPIRSSRSSRISAPT
jgi:hypothetical protein